MVWDSDETYLRCLLTMFEAAEENKRAQKQPPRNLVENPQDPDEFQHESAPIRQLAQETGGLPSWLATKEFKVAADMMGMVVYKGDHGPYGHPKRIPMEWGSTQAPS